MKTVNISRAASLVMRHAKATPSTARSGRFVVTLLLCVLTTATAWATGGTMTGYGTKESPFIIADADDWHTFVTSVSSGTSYSEQHIKLDTNISVTEKVGVVSGSTQEKPFSGTFDGGGNTITVTITDTGNQGTALFCYINGATIKNLTVAGTINGGQYHAAAIVGFSKGTGNIIQNCIATATVNGSSHVGGLLGHGLDSSISIENCVFSGLLTGGSSAKGVLFGWGDEGGTKTLTNCLYVKHNDQNTDNLDLVRKNGGDVTVSQCFKTAAVGTIGTQVYTSAPDGEIVRQMTLIDGNTYYAPCAIDGILPLYIYTGSAISVNYTVTAPNGTVLEKGTHYTEAVSPTTILAPGDYTLTVTGLSPYSGTVNKTFRVVALSGNGTSENPYIISNSDDWNTFVEMIALGTNSSAYYKLSDTFDNSANPVTATVGTSDHKFSGHFDGNGRTLTLNISSDGYGIALFHTLDNADIHDLTLAGNITIGTSGYRGASLAVFSSGTTTVTRCASAVTINDTYNEWGGRKTNAFHAGFITEVSSGTPSFDHCVFRGKLLGSKAQNIGGFVRWNDSSNNITFTDCIFAPAEVTMVSESAGTFTRNDKCTFVRSYYTQAFGKAQGEQAYATAEAAEAVNGTGSISVTVCGTTVYVPKAITLDDFTLISSSTYAISNGDDLRKLASYVKAGNNCKNLTFQMTTDIDYSGRNDYIPIGYDGTNYFSGTFDGQGHTISGVNAVGSNYHGLFGNMGSSGTIKNLIVANSSISGGILIGGIVGENYGLVQNCHVLADVTVSVYNANADIGGIVGANHGTVSGCTSAATISSNADHMGGIVGDNTDTLSNCLAVGATMTGGTHSGAVAGISSGTLSSNYYSCCTSSGSTSGIGCNGADVSGAMPLGDHIVTVSGNVTADAASKVYDISPYYQYAAGATVTLAYSDLPAGYRPVYTVTKDGTSETVAVSDAGTFTMPENNVTISATLTAIEYTITYNGIDGATFSTEKNSYTIESATIAFDTPTKAGYTFDGWFDNSGLTGYPVTTIATGSTGGVTLWAKWTENVLELANASSNATIIVDAAATAKTYNRVTLQNRTLYKDGAWNTLCLPFDVSTTSGTLAGDNVVAMTLNTSTSNLTDGTLTLNFTEVTTIPAGTPFIIKWATPESPATNLVDPVFSGVAVNDATTNNEQTFTGGKFVGSYSPADFTKDDKSKLFLGENNTLYWPNANMTVGACRAYFELTDLNAVREFKLNFGEDNEASGITTTNRTNSDEWYSLDGRKLDDKPTRAGLYIHNGLKIAIK